MIFKTTQLNRIGHHFSRKLRNEDRANATIKKKKKKLKTTNRYIVPHNFIVFRSV